MASKEWMLSSSTWTVVVALVCTLSRVQAQAQGTQVCGPGCAARGVCNLDIKQCDCLFGYTGADCSTPLAPACITGEFGELLDPSSHVPRACECYKQIYYLSRVVVNNQSRGTYEQIFVRGDMPCFMRLNVKEQNSTWPSPGEAVSWHRMFYHLGPLQPVVFRNVTMEQALFDQKGPDGWRYLPPDSTLPPQERPYKHCWNVTSGATNVTQPFCLCAQGYKAPNCTQLMKVCANNCSGVGECKFNFCHCKPGFFGYDCSRNQTFDQPDPAAYQRKVRSFKIFMYELPTYVVYNPLSASNDYYYAYMEFRNMFARDWSIRTQNPWEASLFLIPDASYAAGSNLDPTWPHLHHVVNYLNKTFPFYNISGGRDHFTFSTRDRGSCDLMSPRDDRLLPIMKVVHFGHHAHGERNKGKFDFSNHTDGCFRPTMDVVVPVYTSFEPYWDAEYEKREKAGTLHANRDVLLFFRGTAHPSHPHEYSGGIRQKMAALLTNTTDEDIWFNKKRDGPGTSYEELHLRSKFCFAPYGHGWAIRVKLAVMSGCIPVIIQDYVFQSFEDLLPYHEFSVRLEAKDIPDIIPLLRSYTASELTALREGGKRYRKAFFWLGKGEAYNYTIESLKRRNTLIRGVLDT